MQQKMIAIRKRTQIAKANRTMFIWIAVSSVILGFAIVGSMFLFQILTFNEKVLAEKEKTIKTLKANNANISSLKEKIRVLETDQSLSALKANPDDNALQVILDALPSDVNSSALGASLQNKLLAVPDVQIEFLNVTPVAGVESLEGGSSSKNTIDGQDVSEIDFSFSVSGSEDNIRTLLDNLERSIRTINITSFTIEKQASADSRSATSSITLKANAKAYYQLEQEVKLTDKVIKA